MKWVRSVKIIGRVLSVAFPLSMSVGFGVGTAMVAWYNYKLEWSSQTVSSPLLDHRLIIVFFAALTLIFAGLAVIEYRRGNRGRDKGHE